MDDLLYADGDGTNEMRLDRIGVTQHDFASRATVLFVELDVLLQV